jgi:hypothetical protein
MGGGDGGRGDGDGGGGEGDAIVGNSARTEVVKSFLYEEESGRGTCRKVGGVVPTDQHTPLI